MWVNKGEMRNGVIYMENEMTSSHATNCNNSTTLIDISRNISFYLLRFGISTNNLALETCILRRDSLKELLSFSVIFHDRNLFTL